MSAGGSTVPTLTFLATVVLALPSVWLGWMGLVHGGAYPMWSLLVGLGIGVVTLVVGVAGGGRVFERRGPSSWPSRCGTDPRGSRRRYPAAEK
ncbi:hypothetical protein BC477_18095 [Clavibacter michiganensis subsp. michiganensis]|uniref:Uncharacterized protein n=1 Tax=Clavibacter michiganensis subsp. michiganensis TaxID=33013 RepID=A0A251XGS9_CLAMM|nr:hypothetical protein BC477_18095 [Clavibacter michiganensis subsp. michiganensis]OUE01393.1 hypothetical protein CMMCAS07_13880 [Clavibacter michiganensis subsp. michiganensis]